MMADKANYEEVSMWTVEALKDFLRKRELKLTGKKCELIARVFAAIEWDVPIAPTDTERAVTTRNEYAELLVLNDEDSIIPDPNNLSDWKNECEGAKYWPQIYISDLTLFLMQDHPGNDVPLGKRLLNEYKEGKAYRLYEGGWLKEIQYHCIEDNHKYCFLKANCTATMKVQDVPHSLWICAQKTGEIKSAYCSCTAGLGSRCIHITAMLFKIEAMVRCGVATCTSKPCVWNIPRGKFESKPLRMKEMNWKASKFNKKPMRPMVHPKKALFQPLEPRYELSENNKRDQLCGIISECVPNACFLTCFENTSTSHASTTVEIDSCIDDLPPILLDKLPVETNMIITQAESADSVDDFLLCLPVVSTDYVNCIEQGTIGQSDNPHWITQRNGRITASNFYNIHTKVKSLLSNPTTNVASILSTLLGKTNISMLPATKYGKFMEPVAREKYLELFLLKHDTASYRDCGLFIDTDLPYIGASPDLVLSCDCCGEGLLEIKCPYSIQNETPTVKNLKYLITMDNKVTLNKQHSHYGQVQGQMAVCKRKWCDFFVFTKQGYYLERIEFDCDYWQIMLSSVQHFFKTYLLPALISGVYPLANESSLLPPSASVSFNTVINHPRDVVVPSTCTNINPSLVSSSISKTSLPSTSTSTSSINNETIICNICKHDCKELTEYLSFSKQSIACDKCEGWFHFGCVGFKSQKQVDKYDDKEWKCINCLVD